MGQKVNPIGLRLGIIENWKSRWFATKDYPTFLAEDIKIRRWVLTKLARAAILKVEIERAGDQLKVDIYTARPGIVIGKRGSEVDLLRAELEKLTGKRLQVNIQEVSRPETKAALVAQGVAEQLSARVSFRRAMKKAVMGAMKSGALGIKVACAGRLGGSEMSRTEWYREGRVPLHTLRARIDYGFAEAHTTFGRIGVKVWIYTGEVLTTSLSGEGEESELGPVGPRRRPPRTGGAPVGRETRGAGKAGAGVKVTDNVKPPVKKAEEKVAGKAVENESEDKKKSEGKAEGEA